MHRIRPVLLFVSIVTGLIVAVTTPALASTGTGHQFYNGAAGGYFNAWNDGPYIKLYNGSTPNNDFTIVSQFGAVTLESTNGNDASGFEFDCIGDLDNLSGNANAALDNCQQGIPWGGSFTTAPCTGEVGFTIWDKHWQGYLAPNGNTNGSQFYLNSRTAYCWAEESPA